jgi:hypothetical protein
MDTNGSGMEWKWNGFDEVNQRSEETEYDF